MRSFYALLFFGVSVSLSSRPSSASDAAFEKAAWDRVFDGYAALPSMQGLAARPASGLPKDYPGDIISGLRRAQAENKRSPVWPGFDVFSQPIAIVVPGKGAALLYHPAPPPGYRAVDRDGAFWASGEPLDLRAPFEFHTTVGGQDAFAIQTPYAEKGITIVHERFHVFQEKSFGKEAKASSPTDADPEDFALAWLESRALRKAMGPNAGDRERYARWFVALRQERYARGTAYRAAEEKEERSEGMARYVEYRLTPAIQGGPGIEKLLIKDLNDKYELSDMDKWRSYGIGAAQAVLMDSTGQPWKEAVTEGASVFSRMSALFPVEGSGQQAELSAAKAALGYSAALRDATVKIGKYEQRKKKAVAAYEGQPGKELSIVSLSGSRSGSYSASGETFALEGGLWLNDIDTFSADDPGMRFEFDKRKAILGKEMRFFVQGLRIVVDGRQMASGQLPVEFKNIEMHGRGFRLTCSTGGRLLLEGKRLRLEYGAPAPSPAD